MPDISNKVDRVVIENEAIQAQYDVVLAQARLLLAMINVKLREENDTCDIYTITIRSATAPDEGTFARKKH